MEENGLLEFIEELVIKYPNDNELGKKVREIFLSKALEKKRENDN
jgi:hypothetical protein